MSFVNVTSLAAGADCAVTTADELELSIAPPDNRSRRNGSFQPLFTADIPHAPFANSPEL